MSGYVAERPRAPEGFRGHDDARGKGSDGLDTDDGTEEDDDGNGNDSDGDSDDTHDDSHDDGNDDETDDDTTTRENGGKMACTDECNDDGTTRG